MFKEKQINRLDSIFHYLTNISTIFNTITMRVIMPINQRILTLIPWFIFGSIFFSSIKGAARNAAASHFKP